MNSSSKAKTIPAPGGRADRSFERHLRRALDGLRYGSIELIVHDSCVVQIIRTERVRVEPEDEEQES